MTEFSSLEINNKAVKSITTNNKEVQSIVRLNDNAVIYQKESEILSLDLSTDKPVLSYADSDYAVLVATLTGENVNGRSVVFKQGDVVLDTVTTDTNGIATYNYNSQGAGDVTITVECMSLQETYSLEDCLYANDGSSVGSLQIDSGVDCTSNGSYITITKSTNGERYVKLPVTLPSEFEYSFEIAEIGIVNYYAWIIDSSYYGAGVDTQFAKLNDYGDTVYTPVIKGGVVTMTYQNGTLTVKYDNTQLNSKSASVTGKPIGFYTNNGRVQYIKNIKLKPL